MTTFLAAVLILFLFSMPALAKKPRIDGADVGEWTMDYDAALELAKAKNLPVLLNYTGSDWCVWCKLMDKQVFSKEEFYAFAKEKIILVTLDFPRDKSLVPEKYVERNKMLLRQNGIRGLPTYVIVKSDGKTELGRLGAGRDKTVESFVQEINNVVSQSADLRHKATTIR